MSDDDTPTQIQQEQPPNSPPLQDAPLDLGPFSFDPDRLASLLDPKDLDGLQRLGGTIAILEGLGTHPTRGLLLDPGRPPLASPSAREGASHGPDPHVHNTLPTAADQSQRDSYSTPRASDVHKQPDPHTASLADRKAVYGENILPHRPTTSLLGLMWLALKDKVLVRQRFTFGPPIPSYPAFRSCYP